MIKISDSTDYIISIMEILNRILVSIYKHYEKIINFLLNDYSKLNVANNQTRK